MINKVKIAKVGEELACEFLKKNGYVILERNFRIRGGEIDIIALDGETVVFVEVKARTSRRFGLPEESVNFAKIRFLERAIQFWRLKHKNFPKLSRIDVIAVDLCDFSNPVLKLIKNASF